MASITPELQKLVLDSLTESLDGPFEVEYGKVYVKVTDIVFTFGAAELVVEYRWNNVPLLRSVVKKEDWDGNGTVALADLDMRLPFELW